MKITQEEARAAKDEFRAQVGRPAWLRGVGISSDEEGFFVKIGMAKGTKIPTWIPSCIVGVRLKFEEIQDIYPKHESNPDHSEELRWKEYLEYLHTQAKDSSQLKIVKGIWLKLQSKYPNLRYPCTGFNEDGVYYLIWAFTDLPGYTFSIEVEANGLISWFYRDRVEFFTAGTEEEGSFEIPDSMFQYLERFTK